MTDNAPSYLRAIQAGYLVVAGAALVFSMLWMASPGFRYWLWTSAQQLQYQWAKWEYEKRHQPVPTWVQRMASEKNLPHEE